MRVARLAAILSLTFAATTSALAFAAADLRANDGPALGPSVRVAKNDKHEWKESGEKSEWKSGGCKYKYKANHKGYKEKYKCK